MMKSFKKKVIAAALVLAFTAVTPITTPFTGNVAVVEAATVKISDTKLTMEIGATTTLQITGTKSKITWKTSKKEVATVSSKGLVTAQSAGTAKITATVNKKNYTCTVTVTPSANPYLVNAKQQELQMTGLSFVVPAIYEASGEELEDGSYKATLKLPDSLSSITVIATKTGEDAVSYDDVAVNFATLSEEDLQAQYDATYGAGTTKVSDLTPFAYESKNGTTSFAYSFLLEGANATARTISYNLSIDGYYIEVVSVDAEGYDIYIDAEYLIDSLMYVAE